MRRARRRKLIGVIVVVAGAVFAAAVATRAAAQKIAIRQAFVAAMRADLNRLARAQRQLRLTQGTFGDAERLGTAFVPSQGVRVYVQADSVRWSAIAWHLRTDAECRTSSQHEAAADPSEDGISIECG